MLNKFKLFTGLTEAETEHILSCFSCACFAKKEQIRFDDSSKDYIYLVKSGRVKISYLSPEGKEIIVTILHSGDIYSLHSEANATVLEPAEILYIGTEGFKKILMQNPGLAAGLVKILGVILKNTNDALLNLAFKEVNSRVASLLLKTARERGMPTGEGLEFELGLTHEEIAGLISSSRQTVTTILNRFESAGIITVNRKKYIVRDLEMLIALS